MAGEGLNKEDFLEHIRGAVYDPTGPEKSALYFELLKCFTDADKDFDGSINPLEFDGMIEGRAAMFKAIDENRDGTVSLDEWLDFCYNHIKQKLRKYDE